jgi:hypothetical protein
VYGEGTEDEEGIVVYKTKRALEIEEKEGKRQD